ncbi:MAG: LysM peptidoglycan-binding domain-containing protein [Pseudomonadales bacterium]|nr:LysM peptidoglycan-binding domain-containing protein [Pseudomonadales bacterium]
MLKFASFNRVTRFNRVNPLFPLILLIFSLTGCSTLSNLEIPYISENTAEHDSAPQTEDLSDQIETINKGDENNSDSSIDGESFVPANSQELAELEKEAEQPVENSLPGTGDSDETAVTSELEPKHDTIWPRVRDGFALDLALDNRRIDVQLHWYAKNQKYLDRLFVRAKPYLYYIVAEVEARGMPLELTLLPVVESAFDPFAYSHGRASGIWQFIPGTAKRFGLQQNWWYDGRRDVIASTRAALDYLQYLHRFFDGDWLHALAAYNSGEGTVQRAIRYNRKKNKPTDFWNLRLPRETRAYVPKLLAIAKLVNEPAKYNVTLLGIPNEDQIKIVDIDAQIDLAQAAKLAGINVKELYLLNPGFNRWASPPDGPHALVIPIEKAESFKQAFAELPKEDRVRWERYQIQNGDSLIKIAKKFNTTVDAIRQINNIRGNLIRAGKPLLIPVAARGEDYYAYSAPERLQAHLAKASANTRLNKIKHKIKRGDTLWDLSRQYKVSVKQLAKWNAMSPRDPLKPGRTLTIWSKPNKKITLAANSSSASSPALQKKKLNYKVRSGDSLYLIANRFRVSIDDIVSWNKLNPKRYLQPGQKLTLFVNIASVD